MLLVDSDEGERPDFILVIKKVRNNVSKSGG